jgi:hypothetical protein
MKKHFACLSLAAFAVLPAIPVAAADSMNSMGGAQTYTLNAQNGSGIKGTVTLTPSGSKTTVTIKVTGAGAGPEPAHIHSGTCAKLDPAPKYPLTSVVNGSSTTTVDQPIATLTAGGLAVNIHKSASDLKDYVSCGDLTKSNMAGSGKM